MAFFLFSRWRPGAILDFDTGQNWRFDMLRTVRVYYHAKFGNNISNGGRVITIFLFSRWRPDMFLSFEFQKDRMKNVGAVVGGQNFAPPIEKAHRLYNSLLLPHKP